MTEFCEAATSGFALYFIITSFVVVFAYALGKGTR